MHSLLGNELYKWFRLKKFYLFLGIMVGIETALTLQYKFSPPQTGLVPLNGQSLPMALLSELPQITAVFIAVFAADMIADEYRSGAFKLVLLRPVSRVELLTAKVASLLVFVAVMTGAAVISAYIAGTLAFGWGDGALVQGITYAPAKGIIMTLQSALLMLLPGLGFGMMVIYLALLTDSVGITIGGALGLLLLSSLIESFGSVRAYSIIYLMRSFHLDFIRSSPRQDVFTDLATIVLYIVVFYLGSVFILNRKDITW